MSPRTILATGLTAALLAVPAVASAQPDQPSNEAAAGLGPAPTSASVEASDPVVVSEDGGADTATVLAIAAGALLAGAAGGAGAGRVLARRHAVRL